MSYEFITQYDSPNYTPGRPSAPQFIVIHYWGVMGQKFENVVRYLCRPNGNTSAHYVVEDGRVACIVNPKDTAWHAGNWAANQKGIGIECRPEATDGDYQTVGELVKRLRDIYGDLPLYPHNKFKSTDCPGSWDLERIDRIARGITDKPVYTWHQDNTGWWYGADNSDYVQDGWYKIGDEWYAFNTYGYMIVGWYESKDKLYYLDPNRGNWTGEEIKVEHIPQAAQAQMDIYRAV